MEIRALSSNSPDQHPWSESPNASLNEGAGGASSASVQEPRRGTEGAGGAPGAPPGAYAPLSQDCTIEVAVAAAACREAVSKRDVVKVVMCIAEADAAVACLVQQFRDK